MSALISQIDELVEACAQLYETRETVVAEFSIEESLIALRAAEQLSKLLRNGKRHFAVVRACRVLECAIGARLNAAEASP